MNHEIIDVFIYLFEAFELLFYCENAFKSKYKKQISYMFVFLTYFILYWIGQFHLVYLNDICLIVAIFLIILILFSQKVITSLIHSFLIFGLLVATEYITVPIIAIVFKADYEIYKTNNTFYLYAAIFSKLLHFLTILILLLIYKRIKQKETVKGLTLTIIITLSNALILTIIELLIAKININQEVYFLWCLLAGLLLVSNFLVFLNRSNIIHQAERINELNIENQKKKLDEQYFSIIEKSNDEMRILAHDFKNHLMYVRELENMDEKDKYIDKITPKVESFTNAGISRNKTLDIIISKYSSLCNIKKIVFKVDVKTSNLNQIDSFDLVTLLNNLLDNAIEAAEKCKDRYIEFILNEHTQFYDQILIKNSCCEIPLKEDKTLITLKSDKFAHGIGLKSVKKIVKKYNGIYDWEFDEDNGCFITTITLPKEISSVTS